MLSRVPHRREFLATTLATATSTALIRAAEPTPLGGAESCIMIWLGGGMSHIDTFDPKRQGDPKTKKPGSAYKAIPTAIPGVQVCEHLPKTAKLMDRVTAVRTVNHNVINEHAAATHRVHTGRPTTGTIQFPSIGSVVAHLQGAASEGVPPYVLIGYPNPSRGPGFLGAKAGYLYLTDTESGPAALTRPENITTERQFAREQMLTELRKQSEKSAPLAAYDQALAESLRLAGPKFMKVFDLNTESAKLRESYGGEFGQRLLLSRRLTETGVRFIEVSHNLNFLNGTGWDAHNQGMRNQHLLIQELDTALSALILDLEVRKRLDKTLIVIATEFGRPPEFDSGGGRGHQGSAFTLVLAGGGLKHCGAYGVTDDFAKKIVEKPVSIPDFHATIYATLGIPHTKVLTGGPRPVPITDDGTPISALL